MTRIKNTETIFQTKSFVCKGMLVLIPLQGDDTGHLRDRETNWFEPVIVSETEKIELDDYCVLFDDLGNPMSLPQMWKGEGVLNNGLRKVIVRPEQFSSRQIRYMYDNFIKNGDYLYVETVERYVEPPDSIHCNRGWYESVIKIVSDSVVLYPEKKNLNNINDEIEIADMLKKLVLLSKFPGVQRKTVEEILTIGYELGKSNYSKK